MYETDLTIRLGTTDDQALVEGVDPGGPWVVGPGVIRLALSDSSFHVFVAESDGKCAGYGILRLDGGSADSGASGMVYTLLVSPLYRRRGIGRLLMQRMIEASTSAGHHKVRLMVDLDNHAAHTLYQSLGFVERRAEMHLSV